MEVLSQFANLAGSVRWERVFLNIIINISKEIFLMNVKMWKDLQFAPERY